MRQNRSERRKAAAGWLAFAKANATFAGFLAYIACGALLLAPARLSAQTAPTQNATAPASTSLIKKRNPTGSPLDTLMQTRLWADVPEAKDFVRQARPPQDSLDYQPTTGTEPARPKPRTKAELDALKSELESAARLNDARAAQLKRAQEPPAAAAPGKSTN